MNNASAGPSSKSETSLKRKRGVFQRDLQHMMYGFGDDSNPLPETVALVEDIFVEYVTDMVHKAQDVGIKERKTFDRGFLVFDAEGLAKAKPVYRIVVDE